MQDRIKKILNFAFVGVLFVLIFGVNVSPVDNDDLWLHLKTGEYILQNRTVPHYDIFLNNPAQNPWIIHSWLSAVIFYALKTVAGLNSLIVLKALCVAGAFVILFALFRSLSENTFISAFLCAAVFIVTAGRIASLRPMFFSYLFFPLFMLLIESFRRTGRKTYLYPLPLIMLFWVNLHGEFLTGIVLLALYFAGGCVGAFSPGEKKVVSPETKVIFWAGAASFLASLANPYGFGLYTHIFQFVHSKLYMGRNWEWSPLVLSQAGLFMMFAAFAFAISVLCVKKVRISGILIFLVFTVLAFQKSRLQFFSAVSAGFVIAAACPAAAAWCCSKFNKTFPAAVSIALRAALIIFVLFTLHKLYAKDRLFKTGVPKGMYPEEAVKFMAKYHPAGRMVNYREWGGFIIYTLFPGYRVFIDGRVPEAAGDVTCAYESIAEAKPDFQSFLDKYKIDIIFANYVVFRRAADDPVQPVSFLPDWSLVYWDDTALIYLRNTPDNKELIARMKYEVMDPASLMNPFRNNDADKAMAECERAVSTAPSERGYLFWGYLLLKKGDPQSALEKFKEGSKINPRSAKIYYNIGMTYMRMNRFKEAKENIAVAVKIDPRYELAKKVLRVIEERMAAGAP